MRTSLLHRTNQRSAPSPAPWLAVVLLLVAVGTASAGPPPGGSEAWWETPSGEAGWSAEPYLGGWLIHWNPRLAPHLALRWPRDPQGLQGEHVGYRDPGTLDPPELTLLGEGAWSLDPAWATLIRRRRDRIGAIVGVLAPPGTASVGWKRGRPDDPLAPNLSWVEPVAGASREPVDFWMADGAPPDSLWRTWQQILIRRLPHRAAIGVPSGLRWSADARTLEPGIPASLGRLDLALLSVPAAWLDSIDDGAFWRLRDELGSAGWDLGVQRDPWTLSREAARRVPFTAVYHTANQDSRFAIRGTRDGLRTVAAHANRGRSGAADLIEVTATPGGGDRLLDTFAAAVGDKPLWFRETSFLRTGEAEAVVPFASASGPDAESSLLWNLAWRGPLQGTLTAFHTGPLELEGLPPGELRIRRAIAALGGGPLQVSWPATGFTEDVVLDLDSLLPTTGRAADAWDLFLSNPEAAAPPMHFVLPGGERDLHVFFNLGENRESHVVRIPPAYLPEDGTGKYLIFDTAKENVRGVFSPHATVGLIIPPRDAVRYVVVPDRERPYLAATGSHWTEGIEELTNDTWDPHNRILEVHLRRHPGAMGRIAIACPDRPISVTVSGGKAGAMIFEPRGPKPFALIPVEWRESELSIRLGFDWRH